MQFPCPFLDNCWSSVVRNSLQSMSAGNRMDSDMLHTQKNSNVRKYFKKSVFTISHLFMFFVPFARRPCKDIYMYIYDQN